jgi:succinyl-diaminopimelate desuccinylase
LLKTDYGKVDGIILAETYIYDIYVKGKAAHGFYPEAGINAVEQAGIILANLDKLSIPEHSEFKGNYSTLKIEGGYNVYSVVVPASCRFEVNRLIVPGETVETAIKDMEALVKSLNLDADVLVKTKPPYYSPYSLDRTEMLIKNFEWAFHEVNGLWPSFGYSSSITDANTFTGIGGIPCVHHGPYPGGTHQKNEYTLISSLQPVSKVNALLAIKFLED